MFKFATTTLFLKNVFKKIPAVYKTKWKKNHCVVLCKAKIEHCLLIIAQSMRHNVTGTMEICALGSIFKEENK